MGNSANGDNDSPVNGDEDPGTGRAPNDNDDSLTDGDGDSGTGRKSNNDNNASGTNSSTSSSPNNGASVSDTKSTSPPNNTTNNPQTPVERAVKLFKEKMVGQKNPETKKNSGYATDFSWELWNTAAEQYMQSIKALSDQRILEILQETFNLTDLLCRRNPFFQVDSEMWNDDEDLETSGRHVGDAEYQADVDACDSDTSSPRARVQAGAATDNTDNLDRRPLAKATARQARAQLVAKLPAILIGAHWLAGPPMMWTTTTSLIGTHVLLKLKIRLAGPLTMPKALIGAHAHARNPAAKHDNSKSEMRVQQYLKSKFKLYLSRVLANTLKSDDSFELFCSLLDISDAVITGDFALAMMVDEVAGRTWSFNSLTIIVPRKSSMLLEEFFYRRNYEWKTVDPNAQGAPRASPQEASGFQYFPLWPLPLCQTLLSIALTTLTLAPIALTALALSHTALPTFTLTADSVPQPRFSLTQCSQPRRSLMPATHIKYSALPPDLTHQTTTA
ncbi:hypothetical protein F5887DRAFT_1073894 [Amanita rubescens]|nr:hypothetical protein F5887DRAFT_1073894 [Amanita rubescens]